MTCCNCPGLEGTALDNDPWFIYGCQVYALQNLQAQHYRHLITAAYKRQGYSLELIDREPTTLETKRCSLQKQQTDAANEKEAGRIADAEELSEDLSPEASAVARKKDQICNRFNIDLSELNAQHVLDIGNAFPALRIGCCTTTRPRLACLLMVALEELGDAFVQTLRRHWIASSSCIG